MRKILKIKLVALVLAICLSSQALAQQYTGIPSGKMNYVAASQQKSQWCWAASIQMVLGYYGVAISQDDIVARSYGADYNGNLPDWPGSFQTITANLNNWGIDRNGQRYTVSASMGWGAPPPNVLAQEVAEGRPVILAYRSGPASGHAVVCTAVNFTNSYYGTMINSIVVRDPCPSYANRMNYGRLEYAGQQLASVMTAYWIIRVRKY